MNRLTEKLDKELPIYFAKDGNDEDETNTKLIIQKLGQAEDIAEELGIDLIILLKAVKNGVWCKHTYNSISYDPFRIDYWINCKTKETGMLICGMNIEDYGKTWALTREELL